jgi:protoheme IX farnesyltransferase
VIVTILPYLTGMSGIIYLAGVSVLNAGFLWFASRMILEKNQVISDLLPMQTFSYSVVYLMLLFVFLLADHYLQNLVK